MGRAEREGGGEGGGRSDAVDCLSYLIAFLRFKLYFIRDVFYRETPPYDFYPSSRFAHSGTGPYRYTLLVDPSAWHFRCFLSSYVSDRIAAHFPVLKNTIAVCSSIGSLTPSRATDAIQNYDMPASLDQYMYTQSAGARADSPCY